MNSMIQNTVDKLLIAAVFLGSAVSVQAQELGLYKDGVLVESLGMLEDVPAQRVEGGERVDEVITPNQFVTDQTIQRVMACNRSSELLDTVRQWLDLIQTEGRQPTGGERELLAAHRAELLAAAAELDGILEQDAALLNQVGAKQEILARHADSMTQLAQNRAAYLEALDRVIAGQDGALAEALALSELYCSKREDPLPEEPDVVSHRVDAPRMTREEADALLLAPQTDAPAAKKSRDKSPAEEIPEAAPPEFEPPVPADLAETVEVQFTPEIVVKAAELGNSPLAIYEFVRNEVAFQPYLGSRKGAAETLNQRAGNDTDQASLLLALLRTSGIPARYVRGTVEMTPDQTASWLGVDDPGIAGNILTTAGLDGVNIIGGPDVVAVRCTRVWVDAYIPYTNYRGVPNADTGKAWIPMDPAFYQSVITPGEDVLTAMGFDTDTFLASHISTLQPESPVARLQTEIQTWLDANDPGRTVEQIKRTSEIDPLQLGLMPASLANEVLSIPVSFAELEENKRYKVRFHLYDGGTTFIDHTVYVSDLAGRNLAIAYVGATPADQAVIDSYNGIYNTPPNLVNVRPVLELDGVAIATSSNSIGMGLTHNSDMQFIQPAGASNVQPTVQNDIIAGNGQSIGFNTFLDVNGGSVFGGGGTTTTLLESVLYTTAVDYLGRVDRGMRTASEIMQVATTQDVSEAIVASSVAVNYNFGTPITFEWNGLIVDADRRIVGTFAVDGDASKTIPFMKLTGYEGSNQENLVFEETFGQDAVSTIKILQLSSDAGIPVYTITTSIASDAPGLIGSQPSSIVSAINSALSQGRHVIIPRDPITVSLWQGTGYINLNPSTGAAGYIISGGINGEVEIAGGATVDIWNINLGCAPVGTITGTITPNGFVPGTVLCADNSYIKYTVTLNYQCKDADGNVLNKTFGPTSHTVPKTKKWIATNHGSGTYTISVPGTSVTPVSFKLVYLKFKKPKDHVCWKQSGTFDAKAVLTADSAQNDALVDWTITGTPTATVDTAGKVTFGSGPGLYDVKVAAKGNASCYAVFKLYIYGVEIVSIDPRFAPSVEQLDVKYTIKPASYTASYAEVRVFKKGDASNPIFKDNTIPKTGANVLFQWNGKANQGAATGKYIGPYDSPYKVRILVSEKPNFSDNCKDEKPTSVEIESIVLTPAGAQNVAKPTRAATEIDKQVEALVKIKKKDGTGVATELPLKVDWSFEDPDDTAGAAGIDSNGAAGDDNAPIANGGKRGAASVMWKAVAGFTSNVNKLVADSEVKTSGADKGKARIQFSTSAIGGDNYILVAQCKDPAGTVVKEKKSGTWSVRKTVAFPNIYNMTGGVDAGAMMTVASIDPAFSGDGYTDYSRGAVTAVPAANSPEYAVPILPPNVAETPTGQEEANYLATSTPDADVAPAGDFPGPGDTDHDGDGKLDVIADINVAPLGDFPGPGDTDHNGDGNLDRVATAADKTAAETAITAKAQAWYDRSELAEGTALLASANAIGAVSPGIIGGRYYGPKQDGRPATGVTTFYPAGIMVTVYGGSSVDPDGDWDQPQGATVGGNIVFVFLNSGNAARRQIVGRHEVGHASDHESFGPGDHSATGLMTPTGSAATFSDDSILRLRGWSP